MNQPPVIAHRSIVREEIMSVDQTVGLNVRRRRLELGYPQQALAKALGVSIQQLQKYEKGTNRLSSGKLYALAKLLRVPVTYFLQSDRYGQDPNLLNDREQERQTMKLLRAFRQIQNSQLRNKIVEVLSLISVEVTSRESAPLNK